ncbi:MAG: cupin domain-containing protein [Acidobacteria bacterium]|nr:cupin domain-containing protein [Acidobacteriota bacterium]
MKIIEALSAEQKVNPHGVSVRPLSDSPHAVVAHITLGPGEALKRHTTPVDVFFYVLEGAGTVEIGAEKAEVSRDMLIESPAGIPHALANPGAAPFRFLVVKTPRPGTAGKIA